MHDASQGHAVNTRNQEWASLVVAGIGLVALSLAVVRLIGNAWTACADIEAGGRFALLLYLPITVAVTGLVATLTLGATKRLSRITQLVLAVVAVGVVALLIVVWSVPVSGYESWPGGAGDEASAECGPGGIPTWWPSWLPS